MENMTGTKVLRQNANEDKVLIVSRSPLPAALTSYHVAGKAALQDKLLVDM
jgi:hypothetical protein